MNTTRSEALHPGDHEMTSTHEDEGYESAWPNDPRSDQVHAEQIRDRERVQLDIQEAWDRLMADRHYAYCLSANSTSESDIKLLKWALGIR